MDASLNKKELYSYLSEFLSENKKQKFEEMIRWRTRYLTVVLEDIFQSHNASAVMRTCECFGLQDIHIIENRYAYNINPDIVLGSSKWLNIQRYNQQKNNTRECIEKLRKQGYRIVATSPGDDNYLIADLPLDSKTALLFGTEKEGLTPEAIALSDACVRIPMYGFTESFNISVSAAICIYEMAERIRKSNIQWQMGEDEMLEIKIAWAGQVIKDVDLIVKRFSERNRIK